MIVITSVIFIMQNQKPKINLKILIFLLSLIMFQGYSLQRIF